MPGGFIAAISSCSVDALSLLWKHDDDTSPILWHQHAKFSAILHKSTRRSRRWGNDKRGGKRALLGGWRVISSSSQKKLLLMEDTVLLWRGMCNIGKSFKTSSISPGQGLQVPVTILPTTLLRQPFACRTFDFKVKVSCHNVIQIDKKLGWPHYSPVDYTPPCVRRHCQMRC